MAIGDPYFDKVVLACDFSNRENDLTGRDLTFHGAADISTAQSKFGGSSLALNGVAANYVSVPSKGLSLGTGDFTVEMFIFLATPSAYQYFLASDMMTGGYFQLAINGMAGNAIGIGRSSVDWPLVWVGHNLVASTWYHLAICRCAGYARCFIDGVQLGSALSSTHDFIIGESELHIGHQEINGTMNGYIDSLRITKAARYPSAFTPPDAEFAYYAGQIQGTVKDANGNFARRLVKAHRRSDGFCFDAVLSNPSDGTFTLKTSDFSKHYAVVHDSDAWITYLHFNGADNSTLFYEFGGKAVVAYGNAKISTSQSKFGGSSLSLDGTSDYLSLEASPDFAFGIEDFTIELWVRLSTLGVERAIFDNRAVASDTGLYLGINASNQLFAYGNYATIVTGTTTALTATTWSHVALVKLVGTITLYLNGISVGSAATTYPMECPGNLIIGRKLGSVTNDFIGYMDDLRVSKGVARYTGNFIPPTTPHFTAQAGDPYLNNVVLGCHFDGQPDNGDIYRNNVILNMRGNAFADDIGNAVSQYGTSSIVTVSGRSGFGGKALNLAGASDYVSVTNSSGFYLGAGDFTIEFWMTTPLTQTGTPIAKREGGTTGWAVNVVNTGKIGFRANFGSWNDDWAGTATGKVLASTWQHIAVVRSGTSLFIYIDGTKEGTAAIGSGALQDSTGSLRLGWATSGGESQFLGSLDDIRVTRGVARYTGATYAVPSTEIPTLGDRFPANPVGLKLTPYNTVGVVSTQSKFSGYSAYFDGVSAYLTAPDIFSQLGARDFTAEVFVRLSTLGASQAIFLNRSARSALGGVIKLGGSQWVFVLHGGYLYCELGGNSPLWSIRDCREYLVPCCNY